MQRDQRHTRDKFPKLPLLVCSPCGHPHVCERKSGVKVDSLASRSKCGGSRSEVSDSSVVVGLTGLEHPPPVPGMPAHCIKGSLPPTTVINYKGVYVD